MEGNCYSWLCRLMNMLSFSQHHTLKIQAGQVVPSGSHSSPEPSGPSVVPTRGPLGGDTCSVLGVQGRSWAWGQVGEAKCAGVEGKKEAAAQQPEIQPGLNTPSLDGVQGRPCTG